MGQVAVAIIGALVSALGYMLTQVLVSSFVGAVTYKGIGIALDSVTAMFFTGANGMPSNVVGILGVLKVGTAFKILIAAVTMKFTMAGVKGSVSKLKLKG